MNMLEIILAEARADARDLRLSADLRAEAGLCEDIAAEQLRLAALRRAAAVRPKREQEWR